MKVFASSGCRQVQGAPAKKTRSRACNSAGSNPTISPPWLSMRTLIGAIATSVSPLWNRPVRYCAPLCPGEKRSNETHASTTDPDARLYRKGPGQPAKLAYLGHVLMENRHALVIDTGLTLASGTAERAAALEMVAARPGNHRITRCRQGL